MTRCDSENVFYKVFCIGLLIIAFTFTIILTNVFIDIDGLLTKTETDSQNDPMVENVLEQATIRLENIPEQDRNIQDYGGVDRSSDEGDGPYRTKRSLDSPDFLLHIKNPKMKNILTNRLAALLEELDEEESKVYMKDDDKITNPKSVVESIYVKKDKPKDIETTREIADVKPVANEINARKNERDNNDDLLHLAMHNILLQGIIGHMDLNDVYKKLHALVRNFKNNERKEQEKQITQKEEMIKESTSESHPRRMQSMSEESKFFEELVKCKKLQQDISKATESPTRKGGEFVKSPKFLIKTQINIQKDDKELDQYSKEDIKSFIKLIYNGKPIKIKNIEEEELTSTTSKIEATTINTVHKDVEEIADLLKVNFQNKHLPKEYISTVLSEYLKKYTNTIGLTNKQINEKRLKRNVKLHSEKTTETLKSNQGKKDDEELFVEIETHFDDKGLKGKKRKELIKQLIAKIQNAIHSNQVDQKKLKHVHEVRIRKRIQNPLAHRNSSHQVLLKKLVGPYDYKSFRELYPITKIASDLGPAPLGHLKIASENGQDWKKQDDGPKFLSVSKSINSAELSKVDVDFNNVIKIGGVPHRLQMPLNKDVSDENINAFYDLGNLQFLIKDIEGTGFSVGFNQYVDQAPDPESIKSFTGLENLMDVYHQNNDYIAKPETPKDDITESRHEISKRDIKNTKPEYVTEKSDVNKIHRVNRRSTENDFHSNEYRVIFNDNLNFLPYENYQDIYNNRRNKEELYQIKKKNEKNKERRMLHDEINRLFEEKLKPSEIFSIASLLDRKRRSIKVKRISNLKSKVRLNRFINTNARPKQTKQKILLKSKRNKRQIDKIKIISKDDYLREASGSDENIFIVSDENIYTDRAVIRRLNKPKFIAHANIGEDVAEEETASLANSQPLPFNTVEEQIRNNPLMLKYPHILDELAEISPTFSKMLTEPVEQKTNVEMTTENDGSTYQMPKVQDLVNALIPYPKSKLKVTVKLIPKHANPTRESFKEIHTSINKTYNKDGLFYSSLLNVSEISKIEPTNRTYFNLNESVEENQNNNKSFISLTTTPNTLQNKHQELTNILKQHKDMIDKHLDHLTKRKYQANTITTGNSSTVTIKEEKPGLMEILLPSNPPKTLQMSKDDVGKLLYSVLKTQEDAKTTTEAAITKFTPTTIKPEATTQSAKPQTMDPLKLKLLKSISQNEHLTSQILNKIDKNTVILQTFLSRLSDKIIPEKTTQAIDTKKKDDLNDQFHLMYAHPVFLRQSDNHSNVGIPFIYAEKQPYQAVDKAATPVASLIYNDYSHSNTVHVDNDNSGFDRPIIESSWMFKRNATRAMQPQYFIDEDFYKSVILSGNGEFKQRGDVKTDEMQKDRDKNQNVTVKNKFDLSKVLNKYNTRPYTYKSNSQGNNTSGKQ